MPASCHTSVAATANDASITSEASPPETDFGSRLPIVELTTKPTNGSSGISAISGEVTRYHLSDVNASGLSDSRCGRAR